MRWDNGRSLTLVTTVDDFHILPPQEQGDSLKPEKPISEEEMGFRQTMPQKKRLMSSLC